MSLLADSRHALELLESIQEKLQSSESPDQQEDLSNLIYMLDSPLFTQLVTIQDSLEQLKTLLTQRPLGTEDFDFDPSSGELVVEPKDEDWDSGGPQDAYTPGASSMESVSQTYAVGTAPGSSDIVKLVEQAAQGRRVKSIILQKEEKSSLGFSVVGLKSEHRGELGIFVQEIQPGGIAAKDGRLQENDQILAIDGQVLESNISHSQAIAILQKASGRVELVVARGSTPRSATDKSADSTLSVASEGSDMVLSTEWSQLEVIDLLNDGSGLGFGIIGGKSTGVVVKTILPGGIADRDGRLRSGDHILQIGDVNVRGMGSEQVASVLRQSGAHVRLIVARGVLEPAPNNPSHTPIVPTHQIDEHMHLINVNLEQADYNAMMQEQSDMAGMSADYVAQVHPPPMDMQLTNGVPELEFFEVELVKDTQGLGITIAGYVGEKPAELSGVFVRSIAEGSTAALDGRVQVNDQIIAVDQHSLDGFDNHQAVEVLRKTGQVVHLKLARYMHGPAYEQLQQYAMQPIDAQTSPQSQVNSREAELVAGQPVSLDDVRLISDASDDFSSELPADVEEAIQTHWQAVMGDEYEIVVAQLSKFREGGGLGISLEGTVDVEDGVEVRPHHYIRSVLQDGPVGHNGKLNSGDELLEVNGKRLLGLTHVEVVSILKKLPQHVRIVCAHRKPAQQTDFAYAQTQFFQAPGSTPAAQGGVYTAADRLVKAKSEQSLPVVSGTAATETTALNKTKSRSLEPLTGLAMWSTEPVQIDLQKGERGLGFSILDYQDPVNSSETVIVIRSLVPGGVAQMDGRLVPGDRLVYVNDINLENATLDQAVQALKGAERGTVHIGVAKPLPVTEIGESTTDDIIVSDDESAVAATALSLSHTAPSSSSQPPPLPDMSPPHTPPPSPTGLRAGVTVDTISEQNAFNVDMHTETQLVRGSDLTGLERTPGGDTTSTTPATSPPDPESPVAKRLRELAESGEPETQQAPAARTPVISPKRQIPRLIRGRAIESPTKDTTVPESQTETSVHQKSLSDPTIPSSPKPTTTTPPPDGSTKEATPLAARQKPKIAPKPSPLVQKQLFKSGPPGQKEEEMVVVESVPESQTTHTEARRAESPPLYKPPTPVTTSDLKSTSSTTSTPVMSSPVPSPSLSPRPWMAYGQPGGELIPPLSSALERTIKVKKGSDQLGMTLDSVDKGINGCVVKTVASGSAVAKDGRIQVGDYVVTINNETLRRITNAQARAILRRASLLGSDISITYIPQSDAALHKESALVSLREKGPPPSSVQLSPNANLIQPAQTSSGEQSPPSSVEGGRSASNASTPSGPGVLTLEEEGTVTSSNPTVMAAPLGLDMVRTTEPREADPSNEVQSPASSWGPPRRVEINRQGGESLGISIVGGKVDLFNISADSQQAISGIFIKNVQETSPAKLQGALKTGDRILEVNSHDLRDATHDKAVSIIRQATGPVVFVVQSLNDPNSRPVVQSSSDDLDHPPTASPPPPPLYEEVVASAQVTVKKEGETSDSEEEDEFGYTWKKINEAYGDLDGNLHLIALERGKNGLGLSLAGNRNLGVMSVFVVGIQAGSPVAEDGRIRVGDELLEINGQQLHGRSHLNASAIIKGIKTNKVKIILLRREDYLEHVAVRPLKLPPGLKHRDDPSTIIPKKLKLNSEDSTEQSNDNDAKIEDTPEQPSNNHVSQSASSPDLAKFNDVKVIHLEKGPMGLGFAIIENTSQGGIFVKNVTPGGVAAQNGQLAVGDRVLAVEESSLVDASYDKAIDLLRSAKGTVKLSISSSNQTSAMKDEAPSTEQTQGQVAPPPVTPAEHKQDLQQDVNEEANPVPMENSVSTELSQNSVSSLPSPDQPENKEHLEDPATCQVVPGRETIIEIQKGRSGLGLSIVGGADTLLGAIIIHEVYEDGAAARDGRLWAGDQILEVNGEDLREATHDRAIQVLRQTPAEVKIIVFRDESLLKDQDSYDVFTVELLKKPNKGLGLSIVGKRNDTGVFISDIVKGGVAEADGRLMQGDQILAVNGEDLRGSTQEHAAAVLKTLMGRIVLTVGRMKAGSHASSRRNSSQSGSDRGLKKSDSSLSANKTKGGRHSKTPSQDQPVIVSSPSSNSVTLLSFKPTGEDNASSQELGGLIRTLELHRDAGGSLGLSITGGAGSHLGDMPLMVAGMLPNGAAALSGNIKTGDHILSINGESTEGWSHSDGVHFLKQASSPITLELLHGEDLLLSADQSGLPGSMDAGGDDDFGDQGQVRTVVLQRGPEGLGFSIVGGRGSPHGDLPFYIKSVFPKGAAAEEGSLKTGDQILAVNGESLEGYGHDEAVAMLKQAKGTIELLILT